MIRRIYLDLDDVCNTLSMYFLTLVGCKVSPTDYGDLPAGSVFDLADIANRLLGEKRFTRPSFWQSFTRDDWASVPETPEFPWLLEQCERLVGRENIIIATSPTKDPDCAAGKVQWIQKHFPPWMHRQYAITPRKWLFARPDALLVDDSEANTDLFEQPGNDGHVVLVPRPWNRLGHSCTSLYLVECFGRLLAYQREHKSCRES